MRKKKNNLDEMQEKKLLQIEHNGFWLAFWGLVLAMVVQMILYGTEGASEKIEGEWIVFMCLAVYMSADCVRNGIWDRKHKIGTKSNLFVSFVGSVIASIIFAIVNYREYHMIGGAIAVFVVNAIMLFVILFAALSGIGMLYKKRFTKLEQEQEEADEKLD